MYIIKYRLMICLVYLYEILTQKELIDRECEIDV